MDKALQLVSPAVQEYLQSVQEAVGEITNPETGEPLQIPDFSELYEAAGRLDSSPHAEGDMCVIQSLLGRASSVGCDAPDVDYKVSFPDDHHLHASMGLEWYWIGCHMNVTDPYGNAGRMSILLSMQKLRTVGLQAQSNAGWTDQEVTLASNTVTVTVDMGPENRAICRRSRNLQWPLKGGIVDFSVPGQDFHFQCGPDSLSGSANVLPLQVLVNDGGNMNIDIVLSNRLFAVDKSFFRQGLPSPDGNGGTGVTPIPTPGIYYSWPQLEVGAGGSITLQGTVYTITSGSGWMDHQLMMTSLQNPPTKSDPQGIHPVPFVEDPSPYNGWVWQFYNLENDQAFTGAAFIQGEMNDSPRMTYGYFLAPGKDGWEAIFINGNVGLLYPNAFPAIAGDPSAKPEVVIPVVRAYTGVENILLGDPLSGVATPWYSDGTFNNPNGALCGEFPADYTDMSGKYANGLGYMETVGFESVEAYRQFALSFLKESKR